MRGPLLPVVTISSSAMCTPVRVSARGRRAPPSVTRGGALRVAAMSPPRASFSAGRKRAWPDVEERPPALMARRVAKPLDLLLDGFRV